MLKKDGVPHQTWLNRNMEQIVKILRMGPKDAQKGDWGSVSDDEEKPEVLEKIKEKPKPAEEKKSGWFGGFAGGGGGEGRSPKGQKRGTLHLTIVGAANLPNEVARCTVEAKTDPPVSLETQRAAKSSNPEFGQTVQVPNFYPSKTVLSFQVLGDTTRDLGSKDVTLSAGESARSIILDTGAAKPGCCACSSAGAQARLNIQFQFQEDGEDPPPPPADGGPAPPAAAGMVKTSGGVGKTSGASDAFPTGSSSTPDQLRTKRGPPCVGFCGGPLAWALMYPPTLPQLLHVVVTAEDLRPPEESSRLRIFGSAPRRTGGLPPLREQRALPRERMSEERPEKPEAE